MNADEFVDGDALVLALLNILHGRRDSFVPNEVRKTDLSVALTNSFGFGGTNGSLVMVRYSGA